MLLVEQNASRALQLADRGYVMESGLITMSGDAKVMLSDPKVRAAYLGRMSAALRHRGPRPRCGSRSRAPALSRPWRRWP